MGLKMDDLRGVSRHVHQSGFHHILAQSSCKVHWVVSPGCELILRLFGVYPSNDPLNGANMEH